MEKLESDIISFRTPKFLKAMVERIAEDKQQSTQRILNKIILENIEKYNTLTLHEQRMKDAYIRNVKNQDLEFLRKESAKKLFFKNNLQKFLANSIREDGKVSDKKATLENLNINLEITKNYGWKEETKYLKEIIKKLKRYKDEKIQGKKANTLHINSRSEEKNLPNKSTI